MQPVKREHVVIGMRVVRGPNWKWGDQDGNGGGTIVSNAGDGWVTVLWDNGTKDGYRVGADGGFDLGWPQDS